MQRSGLPIYVVIVINDSVRQCVALLSLDGKSKPNWGSSNCH
jgi:hypothetical protein